MKYPDLELQRKPKPGTTQTPDLTRRKALQIAALGISYPICSSASSYKRIVGANERVRVALMGLRGRGKILQRAFASNTHCELSFLCDVDQGLLRKYSQVGLNEGWRAPYQSQDIRHALDRKDIDALVIAAPDHWHATAGIWGLEAGKHVYVEKPLSHNPHEGEQFVKAAKRYGKLVQMGNQQRSSEASQYIIKQIHQGIIGEPYTAQCWYANSRKSIGNGKRVKPDAQFDWNLWQGPASRKPFKNNIAPYNWHWLWHWGTGELGNNGAHEIDIARWALQVKFPHSSKALGSRRFFSDDDWEMYDTLKVDFIFDKGKHICWEGHSCNKVLKFGRDRGTLIYGTNGSVLIDRKGYCIFDLAGNKVEEKKEEQFAKHKNHVRTQSTRTLSNKHVDNFLQQIREAKADLNSPIDEAHQSTLLCQLGNISYRLNQAIKTDSKTGKPRNSKVKKLWSREFEKGWKI